MVRQLPRQEKKGGCGMSNPTQQEYDDYCNKLIAKFKQDPQWELQQEYGRL